MNQFKLSEKPERLQLLYSPYTTPPRYSYPNLSKQHEINIYLSTTKKTFDYFFEVILFLNSAHPSNLVFTESLPF